MGYNSRLQHKHDLYVEISVKCIYFYRSDEKWLSQRVPISKYIMMPQRMADYWIAFNEVSLDLVKYVQNHRDERNRIQNTVAIMKKWALECKYCVIKT